MFYGVVFIEEKYKQYTVFIVLVFILYFSYKIIKKSTFYSSIPSEVTAQSALGLNEDGILK